MGSAFIITALGFAKAGMLTGGGYQDYKLKREQKRAGFKPYSFKFGNTYVSYKDIDGSNGKGKVAKYSGDVSY